MGTKTNDLQVVIEGVSSTGESLKFKDATVWPIDTLGVSRDRDEFAMFVSLKYIGPKEYSIDVAYETPHPIMHPNIPGDTWVANIAKDGPYQVTEAIFELLDPTGNYALGDVVYNTTTHNLVQMTTSGWEVVTLEYALEKAKEYTRVEVKVPILSRSYIYKNRVNLEYLEQVKHDLGSTSNQNKLYYTRSNLDFVASAISGAEYNWALGNFINFADITENLTRVMENDNI